MINGSRAWLKLLLFSVSYVHVLASVHRTTYKFRAATLLLSSIDDDNNATTTTCLQDLIIPYNNDLG
jgi:hypothetical protein